MESSVCTNWMSKLSFTKHVPDLDIISAAVTDGVTVGHPCCNELNCKVPLRKVYDEYCPIHFSAFSSCCIDDCHNPRVQGFRTCNRRDHRAEEERRAQRARRIHTRARGNTHQKRAGSNSAKISGVFSRRWTHNEQLMVRPCGIVIARATFFGSEAVSAVKVSLFI